MSVATLVFMFHVKQINRIIMEFKLGRFLYYGKGMVKLIES